MDIPDRGTRSLPMRYADRSLVPLTKIILRVVVQPVVTVVHIGVVIVPVAAI